MVAAVGGAKNICFDALDALSRRGPMVIGASCVDSNLAYAPLLEMFLVRQRTT